MTNFGRSQKSLLAVHSLKVALEIFTNTFLTSYIVSLNNDNILSGGLFDVGLLFISQFFVYISIYYLLSYLVEKTNRTIFLRIGVLLNAILIVIFIFLGEQLASWVILAGAICGGADALYYSSYLVMKNELNSRSNMNNYNILTTIISNVVKVVIPIILGYLIDLTSYPIISIYVVVLAIIQFGLTFLIHSVKPENSKFECKNFITYLKNNPKAKKELGFTYANAILAGFKNTYKILIVVLTIMIFKTNFSLGIFTSLASILTICGLLLFKHFEKKTKSNMLLFYIIMGTLPLIVSILLVFIFNGTTLIIYNFTLTLAIAFSDYLGSYERDAIIKNLKHNEFIAEHQFFVELCMNITRIISYTLFIIISFFSSMIAFEILFCILISLNIIKFLIMYKQRKIRKSYEKNVEISN